MAVVSRSVFSATAAALCLLSLAACSASDTSGDGRSSGGGGRGGSGPGAGGDGSAGSAFGNTSGNGGPSTAGAMGGGAGGAGPVTPPAGLMLKTIDACGKTNPAGLSEADAKTLMAGGAGAGRLLYPYEGTVFPRGMLSPTLMWEAAVPAEFVYVKIRSMFFEYDGCLAPTGMNQLQLPQDVWDDAGAHTLGRDTPFAVEVRTMTGGAASGPASAQIVIAQATIKGSIFYNSYSSKLGGPGGNVLRIPPGGTAEAFISNECNGCHSVSADGSRMTSATLGAGGRTYVITPTATPNPMAMPGAPRIAFSALYPDGSRYLATFASGMAEVARANLTGLLGPPAATMYQTDTGTVIPTTGIPMGAMMPMFSVDGKLLAFTDLAANNAHGLALVDFDAATNTGSNYRVLHEDATLRPGWPFILPDSKGVVFTLTNGGDFSGEGAGLLGALLPGPASDLHLVDIKSGATTILAQAMGYRTAADAAAGTTYLPFGAEELHHTYFPTVSPVAAGGYFWVFFDAVRHYGNLGSQRQLWGAALDISPTGDYSVDPSHPAFYLPGQEFGTGNHRAFAALDACHQDGDDCTSGIDCCGGFCSIPEDTKDEFGVEPKGTCSSKVPECAKTNERCQSDADCCPPESPDQHANSCIGGFCAYVVVPQ